MSMQRLTLLPLAGAAQDTSSRRGRAVSSVSGQTIEVTSVSRISQGGRWRTEAMRSYDRPILLWFTRGQGRITISGRSGGYGAHSAVFLPAGTMHGFSATSAVLGSMVRIPSDDARLWSQEPIHLRIREVHLQRELTGMIDAIEREALDGKAHAETALIHRAGLLSIWFARLCDTMADKKNPKPEISAAHRLTEAYTALIERDFMEPVGVKHFAAILGITPTHLSRACRQVSGLAALDLLTDRRHFEACRLLKDSRLPIATVAERAGFSSPAYFTRAFRARTGASPSEFRAGG